MDRLIFKLLIRIWARRAKKSYGGSGVRGELFNTANFQNAVFMTTGWTPSHTTVIVWLNKNGYFVDNSGCHWHKVHT